MAESKKAASKQVMDVSRPGKSAPAATAKPVIVTNRPVLQDPMVVNDESDKDTPVAVVPAVKRSGGLILQPLSAEKAGEGDSDSHSITVKTKKDSVAKDETIDLPLLPTIADSIPDDKPAEPEEPAAEEEKPASKETKDESKTEPAVPTEAEPEAAAEPVKQPEAPSASEVSDEAAEPKPTEAKEPAPAEPESKPADETPEHVTSGEVASRATAVPTTDGALADENKEELAETQHDKAVEKLIDSKQYYLPVNSVEKRRTKRVILIGIILSIVLALAWVDIALDAGLITIDGVQPITHLFSE